MSALSDPETAYLQGGRRLGRVATVGHDGTPHVVPVGWRYNAEHDAIDVGGRELTKTKKFRDVARTGRAAIVIDDPASTDRWRPRAVEIRGRAEAITEPTPLVSWGIGERQRSCTTAAGCGFCWIDCWSSGPVT